MNVYKKTERHPLKWIAALLVFLLVMGFTVDQVYGINIPTNVSENGEQTVQPPDQKSDGNNDPSPACPPPPEIPEPMTLILMGAGLGALHLARRRKKA